MYRRGTLSAAEASIAPAVAAAAAMPTILRSTSLGDLYFAVVPRQQHTHGILFLLGTYFLPNN